MSYYSNNTSTSFGSNFSFGSSSSSPSSPMSIGSRSSISSTSSYQSIEPKVSRSGSYSACACPSWPMGNDFRRASVARPSAYISDEDLLGLDEVPYLKEAPLPPRSAEAWLSRPLLLPPVIDEPRCHTPKKTQHKSSKSSKK